MPNLMLARDAWMYALCEDGPESLTTAICERAYATGSDLVDIAGVRQAVAEGRGHDVLAAMPTVPDDPIAGMWEAIHGIIDALGGVKH